MKKLQVLSVKILVLLTLCLGTTSVHAQTKAPEPPNKKEQEKNAAKQELIFEKQNEKSKKDYQKRQSKVTRKSMKQNKKKSNRIRNSKGEPFWKKWFRRK
ncbi:MAG: hypothetical protein ACI9GM_000433 [Salibacteraceae bacterium]|jgi:hypothetical protein